MFAEFESLKSKVDNLYLTGTLQNLGFLINNPNVLKVIRLNNDMFRNAKADANPSPTVKVSSIVCKNYEGN
ncbi:hypothetical protein MKX01_009889, partial [Papaver californicum]